MAFNQDIIDLNAADGRKRKTLSHRRCGLSPRTLVGKVADLLAREWGVSLETIAFSQNVSTHVAQVVNLVSQTEPVGRVLVDKDEVPWTARQFVEGRTIDDEMTYPNFAPLQRLGVRKQEVISLDCGDLDTFDTSSMGQEVNILVLCHVSRTTGVEIPVERFYRRWKRARPQDVIIVDGAQVLGARSFSVAELSDVYLSVSSKFLGAQPNLGFAYLSPAFRNDYCRAHDYPGFAQDSFFDELASCFLAWRTLPPDYERKIRHLRCEAEELFLRHGLPLAKFPGQVDHIATIETRSAALARSMQRALGEVGVNVFHNLDYSIAAPEVPCLRISLSARSRASDLERFVDAYQEVGARSRA